MIHFDINIDNLNIIFDNKEESVNSIKHGIYLKRKDTLDENVKIKYVDIHNVIISTNNINYIIKKVLNTIVITIL